MKVEEDVDRDGCMYGELTAVRELPRLGDRTLSSGTSLRLPTLGESTLIAELGIVQDNLRLREFKVCSRNR